MLQIVASDDLGGLGAKEGPPVTCQPGSWMSGSTSTTVGGSENSLPALLPGLALLLLLALKANRRPQAWWIGLPVICGLGLCALLRAALLSLPAQVPASLAAVVQLSAAGAELPPSELLKILAQSVPALTFAVAGVWLLSNHLPAKHRFLTFLGVLFVLGGLSVPLACQLDMDKVAGLWVPGANGVADPRMPACARLTGIGALVISVSLMLAGSLCRRRHQPLRLSLWLLAWLLIVWLAVVVLRTETTIMGDSTPPSAPGVLGGVFALAGLNFALLLPFLALSFASAFYRPRLQRLLGLQTSGLAGQEHPISMQKSPWIAFALPKRLSGASSQAAEFSHYGVVAGRPEW